MYINTASLTHANFSPSGNELNEKDAEGRKLFDYYIELIRLAEFQQKVGFIWLDDNKITIPRNHLVISDYNILSRRNPSEHYTSEERLKQTLEAMGFIKEVQKIPANNGAEFKMVKLCHAVSKRETVKAPEGYKEFIEGFRKTTGKKRTQGDAKSKQQFKKRIKEGRTVDDILYCVARATEDQYHKDSGLKYVTPEYITRDYIVNRFLNVKPKRKQSENGQSDWMSVN